MTPNKKKRKRKDKKDGGLVAVLAAAVVGVGAFLFWPREAKADPTPTPTPTPGPGPGPGPGPSPRPDVPMPKPATGGKTHGTPDPRGYVIPDDWDPLRGLWISPDCMIVVEAPGWYCGLGGPKGETPQAWGDFSCTVIESESYVDTMAIEGNGVAGYVEFLLGTGMQPEQIAMQILTEVSPLCADAPMWPHGLMEWWEDFLRRVIEQYEEYAGIPFEPGEA